MIIVRIGKDKRAIGNAAAQRDGKKQIVVVDLAVAVAIEGGKILDQLDACPTGRHRGRSRHRCAETRLRIASVCAPRTRAKCISELQAVLARLLRDAERGSVLQARKCELRPRRDRIGPVDEVVDAETEAVDRPTGGDTGPVGLETTGSCCARPAAADAEPIARMSVLAATSSARSTE